MTELQERVRDYLSAELRIPRESIGVDTKLISSGLADSFTVMRLLAFLEETLDMAVPNEYMASDQLDSLSLIGKTVQKLTGKTE